MEQQLDILLIDDDLTDLALFRRGVAASGLPIRLQTLTAGQQALDYLEAKSDYHDRSLYPLPDLTVLDLKMPQVNGFVFLAWRKASPLFSSIRVVIFSGLSSQSEVRQGFELGANKHIAKPTVLADWEKVVREIWNFGTEGTAFLKRKGAESGSTNG